MSLKLQRVKTQAKMYDLLSYGGAGFVRAGSTASVQSRRGTYEQEGYSGTMYYTPVKNMMFAEDKLLERRDFRHNKQHFSNAEEQPGCVYVIQGQKRKGGSKK